MTRGGLAAVLGGEAPGAGLDAALASLAHRGAPGTPLVAPTVALGAVGPAAVVAGAGPGGNLWLAVDGGRGCADRLRQDLSAAGAWIPQDADPAALLLQALGAATGATLTNQLISCLYRLQGPWAVVALTPDGLVAARDPAGLRSLWIGQDADCWGVASETGALEAADMDVVRAVAPGELVVVGTGLQGLRPFPQRTGRPCMVEVVAGRRADARLDDVSAALHDVWSLHRALGAALAQRPGAPDGPVVALPGAEALAAGMAAGRGGDWLRPWCGALPVVPRGAVADQTVTLVGVDTPEESVLLAHVAALRAAGARAVHLRCALPAGREACPLGLESGGEDAPCAAGLRRPAGVDSFETLSLAQLTEASGGGEDGLCGGCMGGAVAATAGVSPDHLQVALFRLP